MTNCLTTYYYKKNSIEKSYSKIVIYGNSKTGTTACFLKIKNSLPKEPRKLFEQPLYIPHPEDNNKPVLAKVIIPPDPNLYILKVPGAKKSDNLKQKVEIGIESFKCFDKKILLLRDPRDRIVSGTLFLPQERKEIYGNQKQLELVLRIIRQKEKNPRSVSLLKILSTILQKDDASIKNILKSIINRHHNYIFDFEKKVENLVKWKYEDMIVGNDKHIEKYLGIEILPKPPEEKKFDYVARSKSSGDWKHWFTPKDVKFFTALIDKYLQHFRYETKWHLPSQPYIKPEHASEYISRTVKRKKLLQKDNL